MNGRPRAGRAGADATVPWNPVRRSPGLAFGGDYNPEQWPRAVWREDIRLMRRAGVTTVTLGVFSWGLLEVADGTWDFSWLDEVLDLLDSAGIDVDMATPTASPPVWLHRKHPEILPTDRRGLRYSQGGRLGWCASSPVFRAYALRAVTTLARHLADRDAVAMWHVGNELGGGNARCYCDACAAGFRTWLGAARGGVDGVNHAWGTAFWGHHYTSLDQVLPPRDSESPGNPGLALDYERFSSDALLGHFRAEAEVLRREAPGRPVTTNFMVGSGTAVVDYAGWAPAVDVVANDHYVIGSDPAGHQELAFSADRVRGLAGGGPWLLMEHSTSAVSWQRRNRPKRRGEMTRNSLAHVARGADGALFFQWRASTAGAEQFHSAMVPHAGEDTALFREVCALGAHLRALAPLRGTRVTGADAAVLVDDVSRWAWRSTATPVQDEDPAAAARAVHRSLYDSGIQADVLSPAAPLHHRLVVVPGLYLTDDALAPRLEELCRSGAHVLVTRLSGIVDPTGRVRTGGYPGAFRELLGVRSEEFCPLVEGVAATDADWGGSTWTEDVVATDAEVVARWVDGPLPGGAALTRRSSGLGAAWYLPAAPDPEGLATVMARIVAEAGIRPVVAGLPPGVEAVRRGGPQGDFLFLINHGEVDVRVPAAGEDLLTGTRHSDGTPLPAGGVAVLRTARTPGRS